MTKLPVPYRYLVHNKRNSKCSYPMADLNWASWWTDTWHDVEGKITSFYLHVESLDGDSVQRVYCRKSETPRLMMKDGELYWLVDR